MPVSAMSCARSPISGVGSRRTPRPRSVTIQTDPLPSLGLRCGLFGSGTKGSNPLSSRGESANSWSLTRSKEHPKAPIHTDLLYVLEKAGESDFLAVGNGDPVSVARQVGEHCVRSAKRPLGIDHPFELAQCGKPGFEGCRLGEGGLVGEELQAPSLVRGGQPFQEQTAEEA